MIIHIDVLLQPAQRLPLIAHDIANAFPGHRHQGHILPRAGVDGDAARLVAHLVAEPASDIFPHI